MLAPPSLDPESSIRSILQSLPSLPDSIELPAHLFQLLVTNLDLRRAAILLPDYDEDLFVPWASAGFDATSVHRLRIPTADLQAIVGDGQAGLVWSGSPAREFAPYFSRREGAMLDNLLLFPFVNGEGLEAMLVVTDTPYFDGHTEHLRIILAAVGEPTARTIRDRRLAIAQTMRQSIVFKPAEIGVISERIAARAANGLAIGVVQLADLVSQIATSNDFLDPFRVWQDVLRATAALFATTATVCDAGDHRALLLMHGRIDEDTDLVMQHVSASLASILPEITAIPVLRYTLRRHPDDGSDLEAIINTVL